MEIKCLQCGKVCNSWRSFSHHIRKAKNHDPKAYYDKFIKENDEDKCHICKKPSKFCSVKDGYSATCGNQECIQKSRELKIKEKYGITNVFQRDDVKEKISKTCLEKYGVENYSQSQNFKNKIKEICLEKYGVEHHLMAEKIRDKMKQTNLKKYGVEETFLSKNNIEKSKETCIKRYGSEYHISSKEIQNKCRLTKLNKYGDEFYSNQKKRKQTCLERYGVEHPMKDPSIFMSKFKAGLEIKQFKDTSLTYQGSYELDFLENFYDKIDIENGPTINYLYEEENHIYHSDFYIPSLNLVVEIKSSYYFKKLKDQIKSKGAATKNLGYNYILIIDKRYKNFKNQLIKLS